MDSAANNTSNIFLFINSCLPAPVIQSSTLFILLYQQLYYLPSIIIKPYYLNCDVNGQNRISSFECFISQLATPSSTLLTPICHPLVSYYSPQISHINYRHLSPQHILEVAFTPCPSWPPSCALVSIVQSADGLIFLLISHCCYCLNLQATISHGNLYYLFSFQSSFYSIHLYCCYVFLENFCYYCYDDDYSTGFTISFMSFGTLASQKNEHYQLLVHHLDRNRFSLWRQGQWLAFQKRTHAHEVWGNSFLQSKGISFCDRICHLILS